MKSLSKKGELLENGKEDSYERLRLQARVEAQSPKAALGAETTQEGCLKVNCRTAAREGGLGYSFEIQVFQNFLSAEKLVEAVEKNFSTALGLPLCERESFCVLASRGGKWYDSHVFFVEFGACHEKTGRWNIGPCGRG